MKFNYNKSHSENTNIELNNNCSQYISESKESIGIIKEYEKCIKIIFDNNQSQYFTVQKVIEDMASTLKNITLSNDFKDTRFEILLKQDIKNKKYGFELIINNTYSAKTMVLTEK
jgi:predicted metal-binding protein